jgi:hypothetical protein
MDTAFVPTREGRKWVGPFGRLKIKTHSEARILHLKSIWKECLLEVIHISDLFNIHITKVLQVTSITLPKSKIIFLKKICISFKNLYVKYCQYMNSTREERKLAFSEESCIHPPIT